MGSGTSVEARRGRRKDMHIQTGATESGVEGERSSDSRLVGDTSVEGRNQGRKGVVLTSPITTPATPLSLADPDLAHGAPASSTPGKHGSGGRHQGVSKGRSRRRMLGDLGRTVSLGIDAERVAEYCDNSDAESDTGSRRSWSRAASIAEDRAADREDERGGGSGLSPVRSTEGLSYHSGGAGDSGRALARLPVGSVVTPPAGGSASRSPDGLPLSGMSLSPGELSPGSLGGSTRTLKHTSSFARTGDGYFTPSEARKYERRLPEPRGKSRKIDWKKGELIGTGACGQVYTALDSNTGELMAAKQVQLVHSMAIEKQVQLLEDEIRLMRGLSHPNIVAYRGTERAGNTFTIFMEYVPGGSIASMLRRFGTFSEAIIRRYTKQVLEGLDYLHSHRIMHRDIKGGNLLVDMTGTVKVSDFGGSKELVDLADLNNTSLQGTPYWMAPEVVKQTGHGRQADIWSVGCTVIEMATGRPPWSHFETTVTAMYHIAVTDELPEFPPHLSPEAHHFLSLCLQRDQSKRPNARVLLKHPFIVNEAPAAESMDAALEGITPSSIGADGLTIGRLPSIRKLRGAKAEETRKPAVVTSIGGASTSTTGSNPAAPKSFRSTGKYPLMTPVTITGSGRNTSTVTWGGWPSLGPGTAVHDLSATPETNPYAAEPQPRPGSGGTLSHSRSPATGSLLAHGSTDGSAHGSAQPYGNGSSHGPYTHEPTHASANGSTHSSVPGFGAASASGGGTATRGHDSHDGHDWLSTGTDSSAAASITREVREATSRHETLSAARAAAAIASAAATASEEHLRVTPIQVRKPTSHRKTPISAADDAVAAVTARQRLLESPGLTSRDAPSSATPHSVTPHSATPHSVTPHQARPRRVSTRGPVTRPVFPHEKRASMHAAMADPVQPYDKERAVSGDATPQRSLRADAHEDRRRSLVTGVQRLVDRLASVNPAASPAGSRMPAPPDRKAPNESTISPPKGGRRVVHLSRLDSEDVRQPPASGRGAAGATASRRGRHEEAQETPPRVAATVRSGIGRSPSPSMVRQRGTRKTPSPGPKLAKSGRKSPRGGRKSPRGLRSGSDVDVPKWGRRGKGVSSGSGAGGGAGGGEGTMVIMSVQADGPSGSNGTVNPGATAQRGPSPSTRIGGLEMRTQSAYAVRSPVPSRPSGRQIVRRARRANGRGLRATEATSIAVPSSRTGILTAPREVVPLAPAAHKPESTSLPQMGGPTVDARPMRRSVEGAAS